MKPKRTLLVAGTLSAIMLSAALVKATGYPLMITDVSGSVHILQGIPCGDPVEVTTEIADGRMDITAFISREEGVLFDLTRLDMFLEPFSVERECMGLRAAVNFREIGIQLVGAVRFPGEETGEVESQLYRFRIPKEKFLIYESIVDDAPVPQPEKSYRRPSEDVTGVIDLRRKTAQLHVVLTSRLRFRVGCDTRGGNCLIDETRDGTQTADVLGVNTPGATPPTITCTPLDARASFEVFADDDSGTPLIRLGSYTLTNREIIQLQQIGKPGVRLLQTDRNGIRRFQVGPGENFITATDTDGNFNIAYCG